MVKTRFQIIADPTVGQRAFKNYGDVISTIWKEEGPAGFYKGLTASYIGCFEGAIQWVVYEKIKSVLSASPSSASTTTTTTKSSSSYSPSSASTNPAPPLAATAGITSNNNKSIKNRTPTGVEYFLAAAVSKGMAVCATYPHEVVRTRLREQAAHGAFKYNGFFSALRTIAREEGRR